MTKRELHQKDMIITPLIEQGQSPYQIATNHPELDLSVRTLYTYLDNGLFTARNMDLKRKPKFKPRKCHKTQITDRSVFAGRTYVDYQSWNPDVHVACLQTEVLNSAIQMHLKQVLKESSVPAFIYCDPMRSGQKGGVENAHTMLRMVLPKGTSLEYLTQWDVNLIMNHINSTPRKSLDGKTPYDAALESCGENTLKALQLKRISPDEVNLTPKLIRFNH